jgi:hypothetical protein
MNELVIPRKGIATAAVVGLSAALTAGHMVWPPYDPVYVTSQSSPTFSSFEKTIATENVTTAQSFSQRIATIFASLSEGQDPLGADFEAIWDANLDILYQP